MIGEHGTIFALYRHPIGSIYRAHSFIKARRSAHSIVNLFRPGQLPALAFAFLFDDQANLSTSHHHYAPLLPLTLLAQQALFHDLTLDFARTPQPEAAGGKQRRAQPQQCEAKARKLPEFKT